MARIVSFGPKVLGEEEEPAFASLQGAVFLRDLVARSAGDSEGDVRVPEVRCQFLKAVFDHEVDDGVDAVSDEEDLLVIRDFGEQLLEGDARVLVSPELRVDPDGSGLEPVGVVRRPESSEGDDLFLVEDDRCQSLVKQVLQVFGGVPVSHDSAFLLKQFGEFFPLFHDYFLP